MVNFDDILSEIDEFGLYQKIRFFSICLAALLTPMTTYLYSFTTAYPPHRCSHPFLTNDSYTQNHSDLLLNQCTYVFNDTQYECNSWVFDKTYYESTLTEQLAMVCNRKFLRSNLQTIYFTGYLVGSLVIGLLADKYGRRLIMLISFILILLGATGCALGPFVRSESFWISYVLYGVARFIIAFGTRGVAVTGLVLAIELVGKSKRTFAGLVFDYSNAIGQLLLVTCAYFIRDWKSLATLMIIPCVPFVFFYFFIPESPRWLMVNKRHKEAYEILLKIAKTNKKSLDNQTWNAFLSQESNKLTQEKAKIATESFLSLFKSSILLTIFLLVCSNWMINNFIFNGIGLKSSELGSDPYRPFALSALVELAAYVVTHVLISRIGRKIPYCVSLFMTGLTCVSLSFYQNRPYQILMATLGKFFASSSYAICCLFAIELFPTSIRNSCIGVCSMMARFGSILVPFINSLDDIWKPLPYLIFGVCALIAFLSSLFFPETLKNSIPDTIKQAEDFYSKNFIRRLNK